MWKIMATASSLGVAAFTGYNLATPVYASNALHAEQLPWSHSAWKGFFSTFDAASIRRGYQVYREVCSQCHGMHYIRFRHLIDVCHTEAEMKAFASQVSIKDGPNDDGEYFERLARLSDRFPEPYENEGKARLANNGALPPDLSYMAKARENGHNYIFHLLLGYCDPPAGKEMAEGQYYNPYFPGGATSMAQALFDELVEYEDGTPAFASQMAKDVTNFLAWSADPNKSDRQRIVVKIMAMSLILGVTTIYYKRFKWSLPKTMKTVYRSRAPPKTM